MLTAVVPIFQMAGKLQNLKSWVHQVDGLDLKVILVEDGCDPDTLFELKELLNSLNSEKFHLISGNYGSPGAARNAGLELIQDGWVTFWDSDDRPEPSLYIEMARMSELKNARVGVGLYKNIKNSTETDELLNGISGFSIFEIALNPGIWRWVFHRNKIGSTRFNELRMGEDQLFLMELEPFSESISYTHEVVYKYFTNVDGQLTKSPKSVSDLIEVLPISSKLIKNRTGQQDKFNKLLFSRQIVTILKRCNPRLKLTVIQFLLFELFKQPKIIFNMLFVSIKSLIQKKPKDLGSRQFVSLTGGLGNQFFQLSAAIDVSSNCLVSVISSLGNPRINSANLAEIQSFDFDKKITFLNTYKFNRFMSKVVGYRLRSGIWPKKMEKNYLWKKISEIASSILLSFYLRERITVVSATQVGFENIPINYRKKSILVGYFQSSYWALNARTSKVMKSMTFPNPGAELKELKRLALSEEPLIVHVRLADYRNEPTFGLLSKNYYAQAINAHVVDRPVTNLWVFSDEISEAKDLLPSEWHSRTRWIQEVDGSTASTFEAMRLGKGYIIANSTFSWWAATLSHTDNPMVIAPDPWFIGQAQPTGLIPPNWTLIPR